MFRLVNPTNNNVVYAGIREFSALEGAIGLSPFLIGALGIDAKDLTITDNTTPDNAAGDVSTSTIQITVHARQLPKGTYVRLRPLEAGYNPDDWKALLERQLRESFTTLTRDAILSVKGVQGETFKFLADKFAPDGDGICVVDTDLEVDIEALNEEQARETLRQILDKKQGRDGGSSEGGKIDIWKSVEGQVLPGEYVDYVLPSWNRSQTLDISLSGIQDPDSLDLLVTPRSSRQRALPREGTHVFGAFSPAENGVKSISISPTNIELEDAEGILISVHAYSYTPAIEEQHPITFNLRAQAVDSNGSFGYVDSQDHSSEDEQCNNCLQWVPKRTIVLHQNFCLRNNTMCPQCKSVFKKSSLEWKSHWHCPLDDANGSSPQSKAKHDAIFHTSRQCPSCPFTTNSLPDLARHATAVCPGKLILCRFCHLEVPQEGDPFNPTPEVVLSGMSAHELADGARTTECHLCDKIVRLRDMEMHLRHHELDKASRPKPPICRNVNCGRTLHGVGPKGQVGAATVQGQGPGNDLGLCSLCFGPLYVSMYDPENKALRRRIERRYLGQLMKGCEKPHCRNEWCKTGRKNSSSEPKSASIAAVKPLLGMLEDKQQVVFFCVDEGSQGRRRLAEMVAGEGVWEVEWCVAAAEGGRGDLGRMREWLGAWAPRVGMGVL